MFKDFFYDHGIFATILVGIGLLILIFAADFAIFTLAYWLVTIILGAFFNFVLPFSWWYSLGAWLITLVAIFLALPGSFVKGLLSEG